MLVSIGTSVTIDIIPEAALGFTPVDAVVPNIRLAAALLIRRPHQKFKPVLLLDHAVDLGHGLLHRDGAAAGADN